MGEARGPKGSGQRETRALRERGLVQQQCKSARDTGQERLTYETFIIRNVDEERDIQREREEK